MTSLQKDKILTEVNFRASRSSGKGGQHVNKVSTKIEIRFDLKNSFAFDEDEKKILFRKLKSKLTDAGEIIINSQGTRSQWKNRESAKEKLIGMLEKALIPSKERIASKPSKASKEKRLKVKKIKSEVKSGRRIKITFSE